MYTYVHIHVHVDIYSYTHVHIHVYMYIVHTHTHTNLVYLKADINLSPLHAFTISLTGIPIALMCTNATISRIFSNVN